MIANERYHENGDGSRSGGNHARTAAGESHDEVFTVTVTDDQGAIATQAVTITVTGTNDTPLITSGTQAATVKEDTTQTASGQVTSDDVDNGATAVVAVEVLATVV